MALFNKKSPLEKEWDALLKKDRKLTEKYAARSASALDAFLAKKVPIGLQHTLDNAFASAFRLVFSKGTGIIEKTCGVQKAKDLYHLNEAAHTVKASRKNLKAFAKQAGSKGTQNLLLSGAAGMGMGFVGVGLPDIPVFTAVLLRSIYQIALSYGFDYKSPAEQYFILLLIQGGVARGAAFTQVNAAVDCFIDTELPPPDHDPDACIRAAADSLSGELLYMKFLQGIPVVGVVGGACDAVYMKQISDYARLKYQRRFLARRLRAVPPRPPKPPKKKKPALRFTKVERL